MDHETIDSLGDSLLMSMDGLASALVYAPNTVGKTRLAQYLKDRDPEGVVLYNSYVEDGFTWDNDRLVLRMNPESGLLKTIETQGLESAIVKNFRFFTSDKIEPLLNMASGEIGFGIHTGDDRSTDNIKISRAEESIFIWCVYFSVLSEAIDTLADSPDLRTTHDYDRLTLAVIDDPVSSMDDVRIVSVALAVAELIRRASGLGLRFLVTTHHALFFNVLFNSIGRTRKNKAYLLQRGSSSGWKLKPQHADSPFSYHLGAIDDIERAIAEDSIQRTHFNQFRTLLEKTANFLGYEKGWSGLLVGSDAALITRVLNLYSHDKFSDLDSLEVSDEYRDALKSEFQEFLKAFRWRGAA